MMKEVSDLPLLKKAYNSEEFRKAGHELIDFLSSHLEKCEQGVNNANSYVDPEEEYSYWSEYELDNPSKFFRDITARCVHIHHRKYVGHQVSPPLPLTALAGLVSDFLNEGMGIYEMGAAATAIERLVIEEFVSHIGYDTSSSDGFLTSGGTLANLTALLAARSQYNEHHPNEGVILVSEQAHFCIDRAAMTMGLRTDQVIKIATDDEYRIDIEVLREEVERLLSSGQGIIAIVGCSCSTSTGSYDDLTAIADICKMHNIWMHVDGAHGGVAVFSEEYKALCKGIEQADSIIIDAHKMMMCPALATAVLFKKGENSYKALAIDAAYLFEKNSGEWYNLTKRTYETTKYMMSIKIFLVFKYFGTSLVDDYVSGRYHLARQFADLIRRRDDFVVAHQPMSNIVCFRYEPSGHNDYNLINSLIRQKILMDGEFYMVQTKLHGETYLRVTLMSPNTTMSDLKELLVKISIIGTSLIAELGSK